MGRGSAALLGKIAPVLTRVGSHFTAMEDAHSAVLSLGDELDGKPTSFFAVYDGHGGMSLAFVASPRGCCGQLNLTRVHSPAGSTVAKFAGDTVHSRLASNDHFKKRDWEASLKRAYLETDEDLRASESAVAVLLMLHLPALRADSRYAKQIPISRVTRQAARPSRPSSPPR